ncbi:hypothetical protein [Vibrio sp. F74]|uniref:hypothetical protein n=1 Tax=Vibrio sp. F74 TaxID=700020 RepID=UPI0035F5448D
MKERMLILLNSNVISQDAYDGVQSVVALLNKKWGLNPEDDQYQIAMTHLVRAADRIRSSESVTQGLDEEFIAEIKASENYLEIVDMNNKVCALMKLENVPIEENGFFIFNLASLREIRRNEV